MRGRLTPSGTIRVNGTPHPYRGKHTRVSVSGNDIEIHDNLANVHITLALHTLEGNGTLVGESGNIESVTFEGRNEDGVLRVDSMEAPWFWIEIQLGNGLD